MKVEPWVFNEEDGTISTTGGSLALIVPPFANINTAIEEGSQYNLDVARAACKLPLYAMYGIEQDGSELKDVFCALRTELTARKVLFPKTPEDIAYNTGIELALHLISCYKLGEGLFQQ